MERGEIEKMVRDEIGKEVGANQDKIVIREAEWNELCEERDNEEELMGFDAESEEGRESGTDVAVTEL